MLKFVSKFTNDILPSVVATIIGAYIVNHYIAAKPGAETPAAAAVSTPDPKKAEARDEAKPPEPSADVANLPEHGVKAKGISEKAILEKTAAEKPATVEKPAEKSVEKPTEKPTETASTTPEPRRHQPASREKAVAKAAPGEAATVPEERRDANDLARAAIERLRGASEASARPQEAARTEASRVASAPAVRPLPPPVMISTPGAETFDPSTGSSQMRPPSTGAARIDDPRRPTPPADIPAASMAPPPIVLQADGTDPSAQQRTTVAEDMLSAAKSVFHAVLPK